MDPQHPIDVDLAEVVPEPPAMALSWDRLRQRAVRRQGHRRAGLAAVAVLLLAAVGGATQWWADHRPVRVRQELATSAAPSTAVSATPTPHPTPTAASVVVSGDVDGDGRPDTVTLSSRRLTVSLATGHTASRELPAYGTVRQLQAVSDLLGLGRAQILIGESTAGCCAGKPVDSVSQILVYERGALRPIPATDGQLFTLDFSLGRGDVYEGVTCRPHGRIEQEAAQQVDMTGGHTLTKTVYQVTTHQARLLSQHRSMVAGGPGAFQAMVRATATHCPGLPSDGIPLRRTVP